MNDQLRVLEAAGLLDRRFPIQGNVAIVHKRNMGVSTLGVNARQLTGDELLGARLSPLARLLVIAASVIIILAGLKAAAEIAAPILFAIFLATLASPLLQGLENRGLSTARALAVMIAGTLALGGGFVAPIYLSVCQILILPSAANAGALGAARSSLAGLGLNGTLEPANILSDRFVLQASGAILHAVSSAVLQLVLLIMLFVFF